MAGYSIIPNPENKVLLLKPAGLEVINSAITELFQRRGKREIEYDRAFLLPLLNESVLVPFDTIRASWTYWYERNPMQTEPKRVLFLLQCTDGVWLSDVDHRVRPIMPQFALDEYDLILALENLRDKHWIVHSMRRRGNRVFFCTFDSLCAEQAVVYGGRGQRLIINRIASLFKTSRDRHALQALQNLPPVDMIGRRYGQQRDATSCGILATWAGILLMEDIDPCIIDPTEHPNYRVDLLLTLTGLNIRRGTLRQIVLRHLAEFVRLFDEGSTETLHPPRDPVRRAMGRAVARRQRTAIPFVFCNEITMEGNRDIVDMLGFEGTCMLINDPLLRDQETCVFMPMCLEAEQFRIPARRRYKRNFLMVVCMCEGIHDISLDDIEEYAFFYPHRMLDDAKNYNAIAMAKQFTQTTPLRREFPVNLQLAQTEQLPEEFYVNLWSYLRPVVRAAEDGPELIFVVGTETLRAATLCKRYVHIVATEEPAIARTAIGPIIHTNSDYTAVYMTPATRAALAQIEQYLYAVPYLRSINI